MAREEFANECEYLKGKKVVIVGCGAQGLNQGLNMRDSGLRHFLRIAQRSHRTKAPIVEKRQRKRLYRRHLRTIDSAGRSDCNLTPDKQHTSVVSQVMPLMKKKRCHAGVFARLQYRRRRHADSQRHHRRDGCAEMPGHRSARRIRAWLRRGRR